MELIRRHSLRFPEDIHITEDIYFAYHYLSHCSEVCYAPTTRCYHYCQTEDSITAHRYSPKKLDVLLFYPGGLFLAGLLPQNGSYRRRMICAVVCFGLFSLSIELCQHFWHLGTAEIDDVLHNTLGAAAGFAAFHLDLTVPHR